MRKLFLGLGVGIFMTIGAAYVVAGCEGTDSEVCDNGVDDDGDGKVDCADPDCQGKTVGHSSDGQEQICQYQRETVCDDEFDNDADGKVDCDDSDCAVLPECAMGGDNNDNNDNNDDLNDSTDMRW